MPTENESTTCHITQNVFEYQQKGKNEKHGKSFTLGKSSFIARDINAVSPKKLSMGKKGKGSNIQQKKYIIVIIVEKRVGDSSVVME